MTVVKAEKKKEESREPVTMTGSEFKNPDENGGGGGIDRVPKSKRICSEAEMEQESGESSDEIESPRSVGRWRSRKQRELVHSRILRIREEDLHLGMDLGENINNNHNSSLSLNVVLFSRPILPCSPLGGKATNVRALH